jgi:hypothetical protein
MKISKVRPYYSTGPGEPGLRFTALQTFLTASRDAFEPLEPKAYRARIQQDPLRALTDRLRTT